MSFIQKLHLYTIVGVIKLHFYWGKFSNQDSNIYLNVANFLNITEN
jgi:hypothetical protein